MNKDLYWQRVRGLCILMVILIHCSAGTDYEITNWNFLYYFFERSLINLPVGVFFFLAGYFTKPECSLEVKYQWEKIKRILYPYLVFTLIYIVYNLLRGSDANLFGIVANFALGTAEVHLYYCVYIIEMIALLPLISVCMNHKKSRIIAVTIAVSISVCWNITSVYTSFLPSYLSFICLGWICYYTYGVSMRVQGRMKSIGNGAIPYLLVICAFIFSCVERYYLHYATTQKTIGNIVYVFAWINLLVYLYGKQRSVTETKSKFLHGLEICGKYSFGIYLLHVLPLNLIQIFTDKVFGMIPPVLLLKQAVEFVLTLTVTLAVIWLIKTIYKNHPNFLKIIGFK